VASLQSQIKRVSYVVYTFSKNDKAEIADASVGLLQGIQKARRRDQEKANAVLNNAPVAKPTSAEVKIWRVETARP
jgi:hypothetical protein